MPHDVQVQKIVLLPRFTSFSGARTFHSPPINVRAFASASVAAFLAAGVGTSPTFALVVEQSQDLTIWTTNATCSTTAGQETVTGLSFDVEWIRLAVTLGGTGPGFTCWAVGNFVTRVRRG